MNLREKKLLSTKVIKKLETENPNPHCELYYKTHYQLLVSVVLSAQTTDKMVNRCMMPIYDKGFTPQTVQKWGEKKLLSVIRPIGLAPTKSKNILKLTQILIEKYSGQVPDNREALQALPGVGRKTANVILGELFNLPTLAVDTHVFRTTNRLGLHSEKTPDKAEKALLDVINKRFLPKAHHLFVLHGRYICKSRSPECDNCILSSLCPFFSNLS